MALLPKFLRKEAIKQMIPSVNSSLNRIHRWSEPEQNPMKRMFLTRLYALDCAFIELSLIIFKSLEISFLSTKQLSLFTLRNIQKLFPKSQSTDPVDTISKNASPFPVLKMKGKEIGRLVNGFVSTIFMGIIFSPEINFKIHVKLKLAVDNSAEQNQRKIAAKLQDEAQKAEITKARTDRFAKLEAKQRTEKEAAYAVETRLAELLTLLQKDK